MGHTQFQGGPLLFGVQFKNAPQGGDRRIRLIGRQMNLGQQKQGVDQIGIQLESGPQRGQSGLLVPILGLERSHPVMKIGCLGIETESFAKGLFGLRGQALVFQKIGLGEKEGGFSGGVLRAEGVRIARGKTGQTAASGDSQG